MEEISPELLEKYLNHQATGEEAKKVEDWLGKNGFTAQQLRKLFHLPDGVKLMLSLDVQNDWIALRDRLPAQKQVFFHRQWFRVAASIALLAALLSVFFLLKFPEGFDVVTQTAANTGAAVREIALPDGSIVHLNKGAKVTYSANFSEERNIKMEGEVFFDVKRDVSKPFVVHVQDCKVKVLGTSFNISTDSSLVEVIVTTGKVALLVPGQALHLESGYKGTYRRGETASREVNNRVNYLSWKTGVLLFDNSPLDQVFDDLEKHFGVKIRLTSQIRELPTYTSRFEQPSLEEVLAEIKSVMAIDYRISGGEVFVKIDN